MKYTAVTVNGKEEDINKVKVSETEDIPEADLTAIRKYQPDFQPKSNMLRLETIDEEIGKLEEQITTLQTQIDEKRAVRAEVLKEAEKVKLKVKE